MTDYYQLSDAEWEWVACFLGDRNAPSADALRGYLNDRITERLVTARADERKKRDAYWRERLEHAWKELDAMGYELIKANVHVYNIINKVKEKTKDEQSS